MCGLTVSMLVSVMCRPRLFESVRALRCLKFIRFMVPSILCICRVTRVDGMFKPLGLKVILLLISAVISRLLGPRNITFVAEWTLQISLGLDVLTLPMCIAFALGRSSVPKRPVNADPFDLPLLRT